jgi:hypothetical protein
LRLTAEGVALWLQAVKIDRAVRHRLRTGLTPAELESLDTILMRIEMNFEEPDQAEG